MPFWHFFVLLCKNTKMAIFHIILWKNAISEYFFVLSEKTLKQQFSF
jgi:hypothetical protein